MGVASPIIEFLQSLLRRRPTIVPMRVGV